jgi:hypothetical protein
MSDKNRPRRVLLVLTALLLPAATCGLAPSLPELLRRIELVESRMARVEDFAANARLPRVLMDEHDIVVGTVLEYNDVMTYVSASSELHPTVPEPYFARATVLYEPAAGSPVVLEANNSRLMTPPREGPMYVYFESRDCTGEPFSNSINRFSPWREAWLRSNVLYLAPVADAQGITGTFPSRIVREPWTYGSYYERCESPESGFWTRGYPYEPVANFSAYTPPFRIVDQREIFGF